ncbi:MAG: imidazoleglycerol-phosphate dehydratase [Candidatus Altiarchaeales archaeon IMC4]|nr:MAG: imidazoleglycerol-phosphate dehydratase [Candidatus Altiarchaeales archaeon IMC4]
MRSAKTTRKTGETDIRLELNIDGLGKSEIKTPLRFLNHMLENFSKHSRFDLRIIAVGDVDVDDHHLVEDLGICLGEAFQKALGDKRGIKRMAHSIVPMDDARAEVSVDMSGRPYAVVDLPFSEFHEKKVGDVSKENVVHFLESFALNGRFNLNVKVAGKNDHHKVEACFKALAKALYDATRVAGDAVPSTKGVV